MKKLFFVLLTVCAFACGDRNNSRENEAGTNTEQNANDNDESMQPDTTNTQQDTTTYDGKPDSRH